jgi:hypothetical protein
MTRFLPWPANVALRYHDLPARVVHGIAWLLAPWPLVRAYDYLTGIDSSAPALAVFNQALPLDMWAALFAVAGSMLLAGLITRLHTLTWLGHMTCAAVYGGLSISLVQGAIASHDGWRSPGPIIVLAVLHLILGILLRPWPPRDDRGTDAG